jgi:hypothetical protein
MINYYTSREPLSRVLLQKAAAVWIPSKIRATTFLRIEYDFLLPKVKEIDDTRPGLDSQSTVYDKGAETIQHGRFGSLPDKINVQ